ncbi:GntR family transcriptional regulator [Streptomyces uncialis]|uniref:GntR family transcriptional regulator n=1 Tax=Streptomyces uncialis TaxID=1048205 RepID=UPI002252E965|nr:GntR family transcriptional regulator [Streptomyces uncialis]MCX4661004.1 GntR family transcriptional regulator [Streptomyces uncialis]
MRVRDALKAAIENGTYGPGDSIPSEADLCATHGVARMTARRAIRELRTAGLVYTEWGKGSFVVDRSTEGEHQGDV